jgi:hypothetical protein
MSAVATTPGAGLTSQQIGMIFQYTVEAYKAFQKFAENVPNPMARTMFKQFAVDEREMRDLLEMKSAAIEGSRVRVTLGADMVFSELLEGEMSFRETAEFLIARERTMQRKVREFVNSGSTDRNLLLFVEAIKRSHIVELERELELIKLDSDWWKREDAEWRIVHGAPEA